LSQAALQGKAPLRTFGELDAFFAAKKPEDDIKPPAGKGSEETKPPPA